MGKFSWFSTPPREQPPWPTAARCGAPPSCIKCRTTPLFLGPSPQRRESKLISGVTSRCARCRAISTVRPHPDNRSRLPDGLGHGPRSRGRRCFGPRSELRSEEHTSELQSLRHLVCRLL